MSTHIDDCNGKTERDQQNRRILRMREAERLPKTISLPSRRASHGLAAIIPHIFP
jgi:hypothetical protein